MEESLERRQHTGRGLFLLLSSDLRAVKGQSEPSEYTNYNPFINTTLA